MQKNIGGARRSAQALIAGAACLIGISFIACPQARGQEYAYGQQTLTAGNGPDAVIAADFRGGGRQDLAVANSLDNTLSIFLSKADGTFTTQTVYATGAFPYALVVADFNGDGKLDIAAVDKQGNSVSVLLGNGDGTFKNSVDYPVGTTPIGIVAADFNGDKKTDLAVVNQADSTASILFGIGDGTFQGQITVPVGADPGAIQTADFNRDGKPDLITSSYDSNSVSVLLGKGDGTFTRVDSPAGAYPDTLAVGDFNGDGIPDVAVMNNTSVNQGSLLIGKGDGTFSTIKPFSTTASGTIVAVDVNHDGNLDLVLGGSYNTPEPSQVLLGNGDGTFQAGLYGPGVEEESSFCVADFNGDGQVDLAIQGLNSVSIFLGNGNGTFMTGSNVLLNAYSGSGVVVAGDFNGNGKLDLAVAEDGQTLGGLSVLLGDGKGNFNLSSDSYPGVNFAQAMITGDLNGDHNLDLAFLNGNQVGVLLGNGDGTFQQPYVSTNLPSGYTLLGLAVADFNNDGNLDLAVGSRTLPGGIPYLFMLMGQGNGTFVVGTPTSIGSGYYNEVVSGDFNQDGKPDLAEVTGDSGVYVLIGKGDGTFQPPVTYTINSGFVYQIVQGDFNGDKKEDLAVESGSGISVLLGNGDGTFQSPVFTAENVGTGYLAAADFNGDGRLDLLVQDSDGAHLMLGNGDATFQAPIKYSFYTGASQIAVGDFNSDGVPDLATSGSSYEVGVPNVSVVLSEPEVDLFPPILNFGSVQVGQSGPDQDLALANVGNAPMTLASFATTGDYSQTNTCGNSLATSANCQINVTFTPTQGGTRNGLVTIADSTLASPQMVPLTGVGLAAVGELVPTTLAFGNQQVGSSSKGQTVTLSNTGTGSLNISQITISTNFTQANTCGSSVAPNANCTIQVTFTPASAGKLQGTLTVTDNNNGVDNSAQTVTLTGTGLEAEAKLSPSSLSFSAELVGVASTAQKVTVTNPGNEALSFKSIAASGDFGQTNTCGTSLAANGSCAISVTFTPTAGGTRSGMLTLTDNATGAAQTVSLTGTGQDFSFAPPAGGTTTTSVSPGQPASYTLSLAGLGGLNQSVTFTCTGAPSESSCSVSPSTLTPGSSATNVTVRVTTTAASLVTPLLRIVLPPAGGTSQGPKGLWWLLAAGLMGLLAWRLRVPCEPVATIKRFLIDRGPVLCRETPGQHGAVRGYPLAPALAGMALVVLMALGMAGCGGGGGAGPAPNPGTPAGTYTLTVTATANTTPKLLSHDVTLTMKVQ